MRTRNADKEQLVKQKAIELVVKDGLEGFSMNKLAKACNISVATLYIYYKDRDDLMIKIAQEEGERMRVETLRDFDPEMPFEAGLRRQWENRYRYAAGNAQNMKFFEQLRSSTYQLQFMGAFLNDFKKVMGQFTQNAMDRGEIIELPLEVYWSIAFAPLYALIRFEHEGHSVGRTPFTMTEKTMWTTFDLVVKALKK